MVAINVVNKGGCCSCLSALRRDDARGDLDKGEERYSGKDDKGEGPGVGEGEDEECCEELHGHPATREDAVWTSSVSQVNLAMRQPASRGLCSPSAD